MVASHNESQLRNVISFAYVRHVKSRPMSRGGCLVRCLTQNKLSYEGFVCILNLQVRWISVVNSSQMFMFRLNNASFMVVANSSEDEV